MEAERAAGRGITPASKGASERGRFVADQRGWTAAIWLFVILGILIRLVRYLVDYPIWHDEAFLACSLWNRDYVNLLRPLDYGQVAPWFFLAIERTIVIWLGYSELTLRLFPTVCGIVSVLLFRHVASRLLPLRGELLAVAIFSTSFYLIRHGAEIKPYASDLLASLILVSIAVEWVFHCRSSRWLWVLSAVVPILVAISYPAVFVAGGISLALASRALRSGRRAIRLGWAFFSVLLVASFVTVYLSSAVFQAGAILENYRNGCWADSFPPLDRPWMLPIWLLDVHAGTMMAYPAGDRHGASAATLICVIVGCIMLYRQGRQTPLAILLAPFGLGLLAAFLGRYPYGGAPRTMLYLAPAICLLAGLGLSDLLSRIRLPALRRLTSRGIPVALGLLGIGLMARDAFMPYRVYDDVRSREFARWFWTDYAREGEPVCLKTDMGLSFRPKLWTVGMSAVYLFHQRMFSSRVHAYGAENLDVAHGSQERPLRLVAFDDLPAGDPVFQQWLSRMTRGLSLNKTSTYVIQPGKPAEEWLRDAYVVLEFAPRSDSQALARGAGLPALGVRY